MFIGESAAGIVLGAVTGFFLPLIIYSDYGSLTDVINAALIGDALGSAGGTLLVGELFGAETDNKAITYLGTTGVAIGTAGLFLGAVHSIEWDENNDAANIVGYSSLLVMPVTTAILFNVFKKPKIESKSVEDTGFILRPAGGYLTDSGGKYVPTYGVEIAF